MKTRPKGKRNLRAAALMMLIILTLCAPAVIARAADGDIKANHGAVKIYNYDYDKLVTRLAKKYPAVFKSATVYNAATHAEVGTVTAMRVLITNSKNHTQGGNSGVTVQYINGTSRSTSNWAQGLGNFEAKEYFMVNGHPGYCFDWATPSAAGSHVLSATLADAGITVGTGTDVMKLAQAAKMLTKNNYALITDNASAIAKGISIAAYNDPSNPGLSHGAVSIAKNDVASLLKDTTADGLAFKRALVQMLVWGKMNAMSFGDYFYSFYGAESYVNKEGQVIEGETTVMLPAIGYASIIDLDRMYTIGLNAWEQQSTGSSADYQYEYALTVGKPFTVPAADTGRIVKIIEANGGKIEAGGSVKVSVSADKKTVTLTATKELSDWTGWLSASDSSSMIYSSKPYNPSAPGKTGSGQFIVDVSEMVYMRARVKAALPVGTVKVVKSSADAAMTDNNPCYSLAGAKYSIYTDSACSSPARDAGGKNAVLTTGADGSSDTVTLTAGTYWIKETAPGKGYGLSGGSYKFTIADGEEKTLTASQSAVFKDPPLNDPMGIILEKTAAKTYEGADFDLSGAEYTVRFYAGQYTKATLPAAADASWVIATKKVGDAYRAMLRDRYVLSGSAVYGTDAAGYYIIPLGTLTIEETKAPAGFKLEGSSLQLMNGDGSDASDGLVLFNLISQNDSVYVKSGNVTDDTEEGIRILQKETVASAVVKLMKTSDDGAVSGISFTLSGTLTAGGTYSETKTTDDSGTIDFGELPYGTYTLTENLSKAQVKYYVADAPKTFTLDADTATPYTVSFHNSLKRGSLNFTKTLESTGAPLANIPWKLTNTETNETHYFLTDVDGVFDSERGTHSKDTNSADGALSRYTPDTDIVPDAVIQELAAGGAASYGVWFGKGNPDDTKKALPVGSYKLEEMKTERTKTLVMASVTFDVTEDGQAAALGSIVNNELSIGTEAADSVSGTHNAYAAAQTVIADTVTYSGCKIGETYTVNGELMLIGEDGTVTALGVKASEKFTAEAASGKITVRFAFDASGLAGRKIVVYETLLTETGQFAAEHKDMNDEKQIISFPKIGTAAKDAETNAGVWKADDAVTIIDTVNYENLIPGTEYSLKGELFDKESGKSAGITAEKKFTPSGACGSEELRFSFNGTALAGKAVVAYETLYIGSHAVSEHRDLQDDAQTVYLPQIGTVLSDNATGLHQAKGEGTVTLTDTVTYRNLRPGRTYTLKGELYNRETGASTGITAEKTFTPQSASGTETLPFVFDAAVLKGTVVVAYERIYLGGAEVAVHADMHDAAQTVYIPRIDTAATAEDTKAHVTGPNEAVTIIDRVDYKGLEAGREYSLKGELFDRESGESMEITVEKNFTAEASEGYVELTFCFDASLLSGKTVVAFETLYTEEKEVAIHHDITDEDQSVHIPQIETDAADSESGLNHVEAKAEASVTDTVRYKKLVPGMTYEVNGELYDKESGEATGVTATATFTPEQADGTVELLFTFDASAFSGKALVAFETMSYNGVKIAVHADIEDERQTIYIPMITTEAKNDETGTHEGSVSERLTITDTVTYTGLVPGEEYTVKGILMDKETGEPLLAEGQEVTAEKVFSPEEADGSTALSFTFSSLALNGRTAVVFETLYCKEAEVAVHADIADDKQAVIFPGITTAAADAESASSTLSSGVIADEIGFTGLTAGSKYKIITTVYDKTDAAMLDVKDVFHFTPEAESGSITVKLSVDTAALKGHALVVYEELYRVSEESDILCAQHKDPEAKEQTVHVPAFTPSTGDDSKLLPAFAVMAAAGLGIIALVLIRKKKA